VLVAIVTDLTTDKEQLCPGDRVRIEATTSDGSLVSWLVNGTDIELTTFASGVDGNTLEIGQTAEPATIIIAESVAPDGTISSRSVEITNIPAALRVETDPSPDGHFAISAEPHMPAITVRAVGIEGSPSSVTWEVSTGFVANDCPPNDPEGLRARFELPTTPTGQEIVLDFGDVVSGGAVSARATGVVNGCPVSGSGGPGLVGTNPEQSDIQGALPHNTLRAIACKESGQRQFDAPASGGTSYCPLFGGGGTVGVMGLHSPTDDEVWNWRLNVRRGIEIFNERVEQAREYPDQVRSSEIFQRLVGEFNDARAGRGLEQIRIDLPDFTSGNFDNDLRQLELDAIRGYDGWEGQDEFGFALHEFRVAMDRGNGTQLLKVVNFDQLQLRGEAAWVRVSALERPAGNVDPMYVQGVLALLLGCSSEEADCSSSIAASLQSRAFSPASAFGPGLDSGSLTASEILVARTGQVHAGSTIVWENDPPSGWSGSVSFVPATGPRVEMIARHPNKTRVVVVIDLNVRRKMSVGRLGVEHSGQKNLR
jgi:hypothetical protein